MSKGSTQLKSPLAEAVPVAREARTGFRPTLDLVHLARQSLGDKDRETEILALFDQQAAQAMDRLASLDPRDGAVAADLARMLAASARIAGAFGIASACLAYEAVVVSSSTGEAGRPALDHLGAEIARVREVIGELIGA